VRRCKLAATVAVCASILAAFPAFALVLPDVGFDELVARADGIVYGRIVDKRAAWNADHTLILTHYTMEIDRTYKGFPDTRATWSEIGGEVDGLMMHVEGTPLYEIGEEAVVFLHSEKGRTMTLRWYQGKFPVEADRVGKRLVRLPATDERLSLDQFGHRVERSAAGGKP